MVAYQLTLRILAVGIFGVALIHIGLGVSSEPLLGSNISALSMADPSLDSQNRFYGAAFGLFGAVFWLASTDLRLYKELLKIAFTVFFIAGVVRLISIGLVGWPSAEIVGLTVIEIGGPPAMYLWLNRTLTE